MLIGDYIAINISIIKFYVLDTVLRLLNKDEISQFFGGKLFFCRGKKVIELTFCLNEASSKYLTY